MRPTLATLILFVSTIGLAEEPIWRLDLGPDPLTPTTPAWGKPIEFERDAYRAEPGFGLRLTVPEMGPRPISLDFAFPISTEEEGLNPQQIDTPPVRFDAPPTFVAVTYLR